MYSYKEMNIEQLNNELNIAEKEYEKFKSMKLNLDMTRGKPCKEQLDLSIDMLNIIDKNGPFVTENGTDIRNYGILDGIPETKKLFADLLDIEEKEVIVCGVSSLNIMYDIISKAFTHGIMGHEKWAKLDKIKFLCPVPGYDRHFGICESFGIEMINIPILSDGPDMELVKKYVENDETVKGIWCTPKYSNPTGITYSDKVVDAFANLNPKAKDFRIFWDNAYNVHNLTNEDEPLKNILKALKDVNKEDMVYIFCSTSKISFASGGVAAIGAS